MSAGLFGLLDDIAALARLAAASVDDVGAAAGRASAKAAGVVVDRGGGEARQGGDVVEQAEEACAHCRFSGVPAMAGRLACALNRENRGAPRTQVTHPAVLPSLARQPRYGFAPARLALHAS